MASGPRVDNLLRPFRGRDDNLDEFWQKFQVVAGIQKLESSAARMAVLPLYLSGDAFTVWCEMASGDQKDEAKVKQRLVESFSVTPADAYHQFVKRRKRADETVDAYLADLRRLQRLSGHKEAADGKDPILLEQFLVGLPPHFAVQLRLNAASQPAGATVSSVAAQARALCAAGSLVKEPVAALTASPARRPSGSSTPSRLCYECHQTGHLRRDCPNLQRRPPVCFHCQQPGHVKRQCPQLKSSGGASSSQTPTSTACAAGSGSSTTGNACLSVVASPCSSLPRIHVYSEGQARLRAAVDSCSSKSLISYRVVSELGVPVQLVESNPRITAIDGQEVVVSGQVRLTVHRDDDKVHLPEVTADFLVVDTLVVVDADILLGLDIISSVGGVHLGYAPDGVLATVWFGRPRDPSTASDTTSESDNPESSAKLPRDVSVSRDGPNVTLSMGDAEVAFDAERGFWEVQWRWSAGAPPQAPIGSGIGEYSRQKLSPEQEAKFQAEIDLWLAEGWLVPYDADRHGPPGAVLPLLAVCQEHKPTTPVRPCLDYRALNVRIISSPGREAPACPEKLREWRQRKGASKIVDIRKAFLNVRIHPTQQRFQMVVWQGRQYVMERMGFGLAIAPKVLDTIVKWVTRDFTDTDNYIDDIITPTDQAEALADALTAHGLPTKPAVDVDATRVLGLQTHDGQWERREPLQPPPTQMTKRNVFQWCGQLTGHYPVCGYLRPLASWLKRLASATTDAWDAAVPQELCDLCHDAAKRVEGDDPVHGAWTADDPQDWRVWCDASSIAYGVVLEADGTVLEDQSWLRGATDKRHINVAELDAVVKGLTLASSWRIPKLCIMTDSQTVHGWLRSLFDNIKRVHVSGLHEVLVQRRLQVILDIVDSSGMSVDVVWVPTQQNIADQLTRVPPPFLRFARQTAKMSGPIGDADVVGAAVADDAAWRVLTLGEIAAAQQQDEVIPVVVEDLVAGHAVRSPAFQRVQQQLTVVDGVLMRSVKLPPNEVMSVPVVPNDIEEFVLRGAHQQTGHASWEVMWRFLRGVSYFPNMAEKCQDFIRRCPPCTAANPRGGPGVPPTRPVSANGPWSVVSIDTLELGVSRSGYRYVLVCIDHFTKWVEVVPMKRHCSAEVAAAMVSICSRWGAPEVVRSDNGTEFVNAIVSALFKSFGVTVQRGAVRHPQSQGSVERFNRTLLTIIRKTLEDDDDWETALELLLFHYRSRPHTATKISPMEAMHGWQPHRLLIEQDSTELSDSAWVDKLQRKSARLRDHLEVELARLDFLDAPVPECPYPVDTAVLLRRPERHSKILTPFESGWHVIRIISPSTVRIATADGRSKLVNVDLLKRDPQAPDAHGPADAPAAVEADDRDPVVQLVLQTPPVHDAMPDTPVHGYGLRDRSSLQVPGRFRT